MHIFDHAQPKTFWSTLFLWICMNTEKMWLCHGFVLEKWLIWKSCNLILNYISGTRFFPKRRFVLQIIEIFIIEQIQGKLIAKFFNFKKPYFWHIFGSFAQFFGEKKVFPKTLALSHRTWWRFLVPREKLEKHNDPIRRKHHNRQQDRMMVT